MEGFILDMLSLRRLTLLGFSLLELFHYRPPQPLSPKPRFLVGCEVSEQGGATHASRKAGGLEMYSAWGISFKERNKILSRKFYMIVCIYLADKYYKGKGLQAKVRD